MYPRKQVILKDRPGIYHCRSRCVRRALLCGQDPLTGRNLSHRKGWIEKRIEFLCQYFLIQITSFSIQSNHYHIVAKTDPLGVNRWSAEEVVRRWKMLHPDKRDKSGRPLPLAEAALQKYLSDPEKVENWRVRLGCLSEFMARLNERIARMANKEDECTGRFWEGRFRCSRVEDAGALVTCMTYVDLNSVHNKTAATPEESDHCSVQLRIRAHQARRKLERLRAQRVRVGKEVWRELRRESELDLWLCPLEKIYEGWNQMEGGVSPEGYLQMVDNAGRCMRDDKPGYISDEYADILERLGLDVENWVKAVGEFNNQFHRVAGCRRSLKDAAKRMGVKWLWGMNLPVKMYRNE